jgi:hypothetical protein
LAEDARIFFSVVFFTSAFLGDIALALATRYFFSLGPVDTPPWSRGGAADSTGLSVFQLLLDERGQLFKSTL